ncbi:MAG: M48 family metalloprotease, partial [Elusimicrobiota bacterium]
IAAPNLAVALAGAGLLASSLPAAGFLAGLAARGSPFLNSVLVWGALSLTPLFVTAAATGGLALGPILGMMAVAAMTTISFFLGRGGIIASAESGAPFSVPGTLQKMRFPSLPWVMTGVVYMLLAGYSAVYTNVAFLAWNLLGMRSPAKWDKTQALWKNILNKAADFNVLYLGLLVFTAATGFTSALTFLVGAFSVERAAVWTEKLLTRVLPRAKPAPSTAVEPVSDPLTDEKPARWPQYHYRAKTGALLAAMAGIGAMMGFTVFGFTSLLKSMIPAVLLSFLPFFFAHKIIKLVMKSKPANEAADPEFFSIMRDLRERINTGRRAAGKKEIPMPEMVIDPMPVPNAYATGRSPFAALVGVTAAIREMTLDVENVRAGTVRLISSSMAADPKAFRVFRLAVAGSVSGVSPEATPTEVQSAMLQADRAEIKALGVRMLRGVLAHEFSHVMDRHMLLGSIAGAINASIAFASYGVMWAVSRAQVVVKKAFDRILGRPSEPTDAGKKIVEPISIGVAAKSLGALLKIFAALWVPVIVQIVQMASTRNNEGMADEDGALLSQDPESLALALGMLTTWRPKEGFSLSSAELPKLAAISPIMTVNPLQQMQTAGVLPKLDPLTSAVVGKGDDFMFNLFITHPDTLVRIQKLSDKAEEMRAAKNGGAPGGPSAQPKPAPQKTAAEKILGAMGAVLSIPMRIVTGLTRFVSKKTGLSREVSALALGIVGMGASFALVFLGAPLAVSVPLLLTSGLFVAYAEVLLKQRAAKPSVAAETPSADKAGGSADNTPLPGKVALVEGPLSTTDRLLREVAAHRAEILSIPGVVSVDGAMQGLRFVVLVKAAYLDERNVHLIPVTLGDFPVVVRTVKSV